MAKYIWIAFAVLLTVAAVAVWFHFSDPKWVASVAGAAFLSILKAAWPYISKLKTAEEYKVINKRFSRGDQGRKNDEKGH
jgi:hypothetical protein